MALTILSTILPRPIRLASQACGIGFGVLGLTNPDLFLAFLTLHNLAGGESWLEPRNPPIRKKVRKSILFVLIGPLAFLLYRDNPMVMFHCILILANAAIVVGGSYIAGVDYGDFDSVDTRKRLQVSKISRTAGQMVFLAGNAMLLLLIIVTIRNNRRDEDARNKKGTVHLTLMLILIAWFPLIVRGVFRILQASIFSLSYNHFRQLQCFRLHARLHRN
ncbi:hypothetical protein B0H17DRAFT_595520 [Mycena rosella]|uniref:Uncharacterized protein n=1 Tax=Mycena rosella TaxID=1033263 RepID=A0AAD7DEZ2_MYCRO|nr:hypothetical protein B0H17DRAFT_595520 [Mycena rosella]